MTISNKEFENLIQNNLNSYTKTEPEVAKRILRALPKWRKSKLDWLTWWKQQNLELRIYMQKFLFWLVTQETFPIEIYEKIHYELIPVQASSKKIPVSLVESDGTPKFEGGIIEQEWSLYNYSFKKTNETGKWDVSYQIHPNENYPNTELDLVHSALSFELQRNQRNAKIGFTPHYFQESTQSQTETIFIGTGATIHKLPSINPTQVEKLIAISRIPSTSGLSVEELLRVRHRAITDSSNESKLITLWGTIEIEFGEEERSEKLLGDKEISEIKKSLKQIIGDSTAREKIIDLISKLKKKTKNDVIKEAINKLNCAKEKNVDVVIQQIVKMRGKLAHGTAIEKSQKLELLREVTFLFAVIDEVIENKLIKAINFN